MYRLRLLLLFLLLLLHSYSSCSCFTVRFVYAAMMVVVKMMKMMVYPSPPLSDLRFDEL